MKLWVVLGVIVAANGLALAVMLAVRRRSPSGGYFSDTQRGAGVLAAVGTVFAVMVGFAFLIAFEGYDSARSSAADEAAATNSLFHTAELFRPPVRRELQGSVICYGRAVVNTEWPAMAEGSSSPLVDTWSNRLETRLAHVRPRGFAEGDAELHWFSQTDVRQKARSGRLDESAAGIPTTIWLLLILAGLAVIAFVFVFADSAERLNAQVTMVLGATTAVTASLLMIGFLDLPYGGHAGSIEPSAMRGTLKTIEGERSRDTSVSRSSSPRGGGECRV